jgi:hypothetical protein
VERDSRISGTRDPWRRDRLLRQDRSGGKQTAAIASTEPIRTARIVDSNGFRRSPEPTMAHDDHLARTRQQIRDLIEDLTANYLLGGPPADTDPQGNWEPNEAHGYILAALDSALGADADALEAVLEECSIRSPAALRAAFRLIGSFAALEALCRVLDEPRPEPLGAIRVSRDDVLCDARGVLPYAHRPIAESVNSTLKAPWRNQRAPRVGASRNHVALLHRALWNNHVAWNNFNTAHADDAAPD